MMLPPVTAQEVLEFIAFKRAQGWNAEHVLRSTEIWVLETVLDRDEPECLTS